MVYLDQLYNLDFKRMKPKGNKDYVWLGLVNIDLLMELDHSDNTDGDPVFGDQWLVMKVYRESKNVLWFEQGYLIDCPVEYAIMKLNMKYPCVPIFRFMDRKNHPYIINDGDGNKRTKTILTPKKENTQEENEGWVWLSN